MDSFRSGCLVFLGGGAGSVIRWLIQTAFAALWPSFPLGTLIVNTVGAALMGALSFAALDAARMSAEWRLLVGTGALGGFTTYSAFNQEALALWTQGQPLRATAYIALTVGLCLGLGVAGHAGARALLS